jgi:RNA polymerase sigma-70 factor, ECF subfamily
LTARPESSDDLAGLQTGSPEAWGALYESNSVWIWRYVARLLGANHNAVADTVQETFLAAARSASAYDPERGSIRAWLTGIAHNQVLLHWRKAATRRVDSAEPHFDDSPGGGAAPEERLLTDESVDLVRRVLAELPADYAVCLLAKYNDGLSIDQMVDRSGGSVESERSRLARARREFRRRYEAATLHEVERLK